jgi:hypothetical protein
MFNWSDPLRHFWGESALDEIRGLERECNRLLQKVQRAMQLAGQPWILNPSTAGVMPAKLTDESALVVNYNGQIPPTIVTHQPVHYQLVQQAWSLHDKALEQVGLTELQTSGGKPPGIESGRALEQLSEEHLIRFKSVSQAYESFVAEDISRQVLRASEELDGALKALNRGPLKLWPITGRSAKQLKWSDVAMEPDDLRIEIWPASSMPQTPAGRIEAVERLLENELIDKRRGISLLEFPDLESETNIQTADRDLVEWQLEQTLELGKEILPEEFQDLEYAQQRFVYSAERAIIDGIPQANLEKARTFLTVLTDMIAQRNPPQPPPVPGMPPMPAAPPVPGGAPAPAPQVPPEVLAALGGPAQ